MRTGLWVVLAAAIALTACGKEPGSGGPGEPAAKPKTGNASAEDVAEESRGKVRCPAKIETPARAAGAAVDDVLGVRTGMTYEEAANIVLCTNDMLVVNADTSRRFDINTYGQTIRQGFSAKFAEARVEKTSEQYLQEMSERAAARSGNAVQAPDTKPGQAKWYVTTMGMPQQERVIAAAREEWFAEGKNPTTESVEAKMLEKYGPPTRSQKAANRVYLTWAHDPAGKLITEGSPLFNQCSGNPDPDGGTNFSPECGIVVSAVIYPMQENPALSQRFQVGVIDQARGYERITATETGFQQQDAQRRAKEVESASKKAAAPQL